MLWKISSNVAALKASVKGSNAVNMERERNLALNSVGFETTTSCSHGVRSTTVLQTLPNLDQGFVNPVVGQSIF